MRATAWGALLAAVLLAGACSSSPTSTASAPTTAAAPAAPAPSLAPLAPPGEVATISLDLVDASRPTVTSGGHRVASTRSLPTTVWVPPGAGPFPTIVFAHGFRDGVGPYTRFLEVLATHGYLVAAPSFPLTDEARAGADLDEDDLVNEPADLTFVLDQLLADPQLGPRVDPARLGAAGHSDGASAVVQLAFGPTGADPRLQAVVALTGASPGPGPLHGPPMLLEQSDHDEYDQLSVADELLAQVVTPAWFLELHGATHAGPVEGDGDYTPVLDATVLAFLDRYLAGTSGDDAAIAAPAAAHPDLATLQPR